MTARFNLAAVHRVPSTYVDYYRAHNTGTYGSGTGPTQLLAGKPLVHIPDLTATEPYQHGDPDRRALVNLGGARAYLMVPLLRDRAVLGYIMIYRQEQGSFSDKQIALLQNFAAQAAIAMENARLLTETNGALEQQTATAEILQVINSSPGDLAPVFDAILEKAHSLCGAAYGALAFYDGEYFRAVAIRGYPDQVAEVIRLPYRGNAFHQRLLRGERYSHIPDALAVASELSDSAGGAGKDAGFRTFLMVPLRKDNTLLGHISASRREVQPFSEKEIALLESFAAQAVIAMENARLLGELRERTSDLEESLKYQAATSDVLQVISRSTFDLEPVLQNLAETAVRICAADGGVVNLLHPDGLYRMAAATGASAEYRELKARTAIAPGRGSLVGRTALEGRVVHIPDADRS
jgi:GAF domain-containing protein